MRRAPHRYQHNAQAPAGEEALTPATERSAERNDPMDDFTVCSMQANSAGTAVSSLVERHDGSLVVVLNGSPVSRAQRLNEAVREMAQQIRRRLPHGRSSDWGVAVTCTSGSFSFGYGNLAGGGGGGSPASFSQCVQRLVVSFPNPQAGLGAALEHAERALTECCT